MRLHVSAPLRWSDLDAYGHVNNARMLTLLEEARIHALWSRGAAAGADASTAVVDASAGSDTVMLIANQQIEYLVPIDYSPDPLDIELWFGRLGGASFELCYEVYSTSGLEPRVLFTRASTTIVVIDAATERPRRLNDVERGAWQPYVEEPVVFRR